MASAGPRYSPGTMARYTAGEAISRGQWVYLSHANEVKVAKSNDLGTLRVIGASFMTAPAGARILVIHHGDFPGFAGLTPAAKYFLQPNGFFGVTVPNGPGVYAIPLGYAKDEATFHVQIGEAKIRK